MTAPPNGHWFRFSLRTMFIVVTLLGTWLGWQLKIVRDRRDELAKLAKGDGWFITEAEYQQTPSRPPADPTAYRMPFGEPGLAINRLPKSVLKSRSRSSKGSE